MGITEYYYRVFENRMETEDLSGRYKLLGPYYWDISTLVAFFLIG